MLFVLAATERLVTFDGLPLHPLIVHVVVVLLPLSAMGLLAILLRPDWRARYTALVLGGLAMGALATVLAVYAGEQLALVTGISEQHRRLGKWLQYDSLLLLASAAWWAWSLRRSSDGRPQRAPTLVEFGSAFFAVAALMLTAVVGHSGASHVWKLRIDPPSAPSQALAAISAAQVATHAVPSDCWTVINGSVYALTDWIDKHPGGPEFISAACGVNASEAFNAEHRGLAGPAQFLAEYEIGELD